MSQITRFIKKSDSYMSIVNHNNNNIVVFYSFDKKKKAPHPRFIQSVSESEIPVVNHYLQTYKLSNYKAGKIQIVLENSLMQLIYNGLILVSWKIKNRDNYYGVLMGMLSYVQKKINAIIFEFKNKDLKSDFQEFYKYVHSNKSENAPWFNQQYQVVS